MRHLCKTGLDYLKNHRKKAIFITSGLILMIASIVFINFKTTEKNAILNANNIVEAETFNPLPESPVETIVETVVETAILAETPVETLVETAVETPVETVVETPVEPQSKKSTAKNTPVPIVVIAPVNNAEDPKPKRQAAEEVDISDVILDEPIPEQPKAAPAPVETPAVAVPVETPSIPVSTPVETPEATVPVETPSTPAPVETPVVAVPVETPQTSTPVETETPVTPPPAVEPVPETPPVAPVILGVDVSKWNGKIDWKQVKASGIHFAIVRVGYRTLGTGTLFEDPYAKYNLEQAHANGIKVGAYFFSTAISELEALEEAVWVSNFIKPYTISYPVAYDCEQFGSSRQATLTKAERTNLAITFLDVVKRNGYTPLFYGSKNDLTNHWDTALLRSKYKIWAAQYPKISYPDTPKSTYPGTHAIWQFTSNGTVPGINTAVDLNIDYIGF